ncbi:MAG: hypothetical protein JWN92_49 [Candidatus Acidoferrum typicum]|nr:hypothetical protein [Candidatus Acidoferrum typicum]
MSNSTFSKITSGIIILFVCTAVPVFGQRGGGGGSHGGGGGGFHGGGDGGVHGGGGGGGGARMGGGGSPGGGSRSGASPNVGGGYSRPMSGVAPRSGAVRSGGRVFSYYGRSAAGGQRPAASSMARSEVDGQWHTFGGVPSGHGPVASAWQTRGSPGTSWQTFGGAGTAGAHTTRSFSGQGNQIWENAPLVRKAGPSRTISGFRGNLNGFGAFRTPRLGAPFMSRRGFGFREPERCWNCGFGWGFGLGWWPGWGFSWGRGWWPGWGFGWPSFGYWNWGPAWIDPIWGWPGYYYGGYAPGYAPDYSYDGNYSSSTPPENDQSNDVRAAPVDEGYPPSSPEVKVEMPVFLYMKDGSVYAANDYWVEDGKLHYVLSTGAEKMVDLDQVDIKLTISENVDLGAVVIFKPRPK